jgi:protein CpxP
MKTRIFLVAALFAVGCFTASAQQQTQKPKQQQEVNAPKMNPEEMAKKQTERMAIDLKLNEKQKTEVAAINLKYAKLRSEIMKANQGDPSKREAARAKMQETETQKNAELKKVLSDEQFKLYDELNKKRQEERRQKMGQSKGQGEPGSEKRGNKRGEGK